MKISHFFSMTAKKTGQIHGKFLATVKTGEHYYGRKIIKSNLYRVKNFCELDLFVNLIKLFCSMYVLFNVLFLCILNFALIELKSIFWHTIWIFYTVLTQIRLFWWLKSVWSTFSCLNIRLAEYKTLVKSVKENKVQIVLPEMNLRLFFLSLIVQYSANAELRPESDRVSFIKCHHDFEIVKTLRISTMH